MPTNLRPRVEQFNPFRAIRPTSAGAQLDTYVQPTVDRSGVSDSLSILESIRDLSPSAAKFLDRAYAADQEQVQAEAQAAVADLTPDEIRAQSERDWEGISQERGIDNPWWKIRLDEAAGRRFGLEFAERLIARGQEASNPDDPNAHLRVIEEERAALTGGMNDFQRLQFEDVAASASEKFVLTAATNREQRFQAKIEQQFRDDVRGLVREAMDPALGGAVDIQSLRSVIESERARSGNDGRAELFGALQMAMNVEVAQADSQAELDALRVQATAVLQEVGGQSFGGETPLEEAEALRLDAAEADLENAINARSDFLLNQADRSRQRAEREIQDFALGQASRLFSEEIEPEAASDEMIAKAREIAERDGLNPDSLIGAGRVALQEHTTSVESTRFAAIDDPEAVRGLESMLSGEGFNPGWFGVALSGALNDRKITRQTYADLLASASDGQGQAVLKAATAPVNALTGNMGERVVKAAGPLLDSIPDPAKRDEAEALLLAEVDEIMASERGILAGEIQSRGLEQSAAAVDAWTKDFLSRSPVLIQDAIRGVQEQVGPAMDPQLAFRKRLQASPAYQTARERWIYDYAKARLDEDSAAATLGAQVGDAFTVGDAAVMIAAGRARTEIGFNLEREAEEALLATIQAQAGLDKGSISAALTAADALLRGGSLTPPVPTGGAVQTADTAAKKADEADAAVQAGVKGAAEARAATTAAAQAQAAAEAGGPPALARMAEDQAAAALKEQQRVAARQSAFHQGRAQDVAIRLSDAPGAGLNEAERLTVFNGRIFPGGESTRDWSSRLKRAQQAENDLIGSRLYLGLTLKEVQEMKAILPVRTMIGEGSMRQAATMEVRVNLDPKTVTPATVPFFQSVAELDAADLSPWLTLFPGYTADSFKAAQRFIILERLPQKQ